MKKLLSITTCLLTVFTLSVSLFLIDASAASFPSQYNNDIENPMYVTSVKDQADFGVCWAFSAVSCCESEAIKNHGANKDTLDLSELHLAYFAYNAQKTGTGDTISTTRPFYEIGGDISLAMLTLSNWIGLVSEDTAKFSDFLEDPDMTLDQSLAYKRPEYYIKNAYRYNYATDLELIKQAIMNFGAIQTGYYADDAFLNEKTSAYYCPQAYSMNHAISIIGWDDNYPKENFAPSARPTKNGAWLVKNSWGENRGVNGYFWLSFEDKSIQDAVAYDVEPAETFLANKNYQHDGGFSLIYYTYETVTAANIFQAEDNESIVAVSVFAQKAKNSPYTLRIYKNPAKLTPQAFMNSQIVYQQSGTIPYSGVNTIDIPTPIALRKGDTFIISIETTAILGFDGTQSISDGVNIVSQSLVSVLPNQTYISVDGEGFYDLSDTSQGVRPTNVRIKAFTKSDSEIGKAILYSTPSMSPIEYGQSLRRSQLTGGVVIDSISNKAINGKWSFKNESLIVSDKADIEIVFTPSDNRYDSITQTIPASVNTSTPSIELFANTDTYRSGEAILLDLTVKNPHLSGISDYGGITYAYKVDDGPYEEFIGPSFDIEDLLGDTLYITVSTNEIKGKYAPASKTLEFSIYKSETQTELITDTDTETVTESDIYTDDTAQKVPIESVTDSYITEDFTQNSPSETKAPFSEEMTENSTNETDDTPKDTSDSQQNDTENEFNKNDGEQNSSDDKNPSEDTKEDTDTESEPDSEPESEPESENIGELIGDELFSAIGCESAVSLSALFCICTLSIITITKKRKRQ